MRRAVHISTSNFESSPLWFEWGMSPIGSCAWSIVLREWLYSDGPLMEGVHQQGWALRSQSLAYFPLPLLLTTAVTCPSVLLLCAPGTWSVYPLGLQAKASPISCTLLLLALYHHYRVWWMLLHQIHLNKPHSWESTPGASSYCKEPVTKTSIRSNGNK